MSPMRIWHRRKNSGAHTRYAVRGDVRHDGKTRQKALRCTHGHTTMASPHPHRLCHTVMLREETCATMAKHTRQHSNALTATPQWLHHTCTGSAMPRQATATTGDEWNRKRREERQV
ncbi:hypothetical protein ABVT39_012016 [Epinephelus coioides]